MRRMLLSLLRRDLGSAVACRHRSAAGRADARHRHAWRAGAAGRLHSISPTPIPTRRRAAASTMAWLGTFDSLNPFIVQGDGGARHARPGLRQQRLRDADDALADEPFTLYRCSPKRWRPTPSAAWSSSRSTERAKFSDGQPVTPDDVIFTLRAAARQGPAALQALGSSKIAKMEKVGERGVRFTFNDKADRELPLILGLMPILPKHAIDAGELRQVDAEAADRQRPLHGSSRCGRASTSSLQAQSRLLGEGPAVQARLRQLRRDPRRTIIRDENAMFEAFKKGVVDVQIEDRHRPLGERLRISRRSTDGRVVKETFETGLPSGMFGFVFNTRRPVFADRGVRAALAGLFDFEWANRNLFSGAYTRTKSYYRRFRAVLDRHAGERRGEGAAGALPRRGDARDHGRHLDSRRCPTAAAATAPS